MPRDIVFYQAEVIIRVLFFILFTLAIFIICFEISSSAKTIKTDLWNKILNFLCNINSKVIFNFVRNWFELLKWLMITGAITFIAEKSKDETLLNIMYVTYFFLFVYLMTISVKLLNSIVKVHKYILIDFKPIHEIRLIFLDTNGKIKNNIDISSLKIDKRLRKDLIKSILKFSFLEGLLFLYVMLLILMYSTMLLSGVSIIGLYDRIHDIITKLGVL